ncbi:MAG: hypothetical protein LKF53_02790 [Solobacterium sp.]|jgi:hypothetical protein|nr:hypothetical protein [Solobacterium sp.]MCH4205306.1 hypothetical protein [Solobacterium sp.]MCH4226899.1 hypothetical protein [Solobacterium sp.]MCH4281659.1 hypothetical protein [Solobacterium sp.]
MASKVSKEVNRDTVINKCSDQVIAIAKRHDLTIDEMMMVMRKARKAAVSNAKV